jgi:hypothetical protein
MRIPDADPGDQNHADSCGCGCGCGSATLIATVILLLPEDFSSESKMHRKRGIVLGSDIKAILENRVNQDPVISTRSLKINAKEPIKVLKKVTKPCMDGIAAGCQ